MDDKQVTHILKNSKLSEQQLRNIMSLPEEDILEIASGLADKHGISLDSVGSADSEIPQDDPTTVVDESQPEPGMFESFTNSLSHQVRMAQNQLQGSSQATARHLGTALQAGHEIASDPAKVAKEAVGIGVEGGSTIAGNTLGLMVPGGGLKKVAMGTILGTLGGIGAREGLEAVGFREDTPMLTGDKGLSMLLDFVSGPIGAVGARQLSKGGQAMAEAYDRFSKSLDTKARLVEILGLGRKRGTALETVKQLENSVEIMLRETRDTILRTGKVPQEKVFRPIVEKLDVARKEAGEELGRFYEKITKAHTAKNNGVAKKFSFGDMFSKIQKVVDDPNIIPEVRDDYVEALNRHLDTLKAEVFSPDDVREIDAALARLQRPEIKREIGHIDFVHGSEQTLDALKPRTTFERVDGQDVAIIPSDKAAQKLYDDALKDMKLVQGYRTKLANAEIYDLKRINEWRQQFAREGNLATGPDKRGSQRVLLDLEDIFDEKFQEETKWVSGVADDGTELGSLSGDLEELRDYYGAVKDTFRRFDDNLSKEMNRARNEFISNFADDPDPGGMFIDARLGGMQAGFRGRQKKDFAKSSYQKYIDAYDAISDAAINPPGKAKATLMEWSGKAGGALAKLDPFQTTTGAFFSGTTSELVSELAEELQIAGDLGAEEFSPETVNAVQALASAQAEGAGKTEEEQREILFNLVAIPEVRNLGVFAESDNPLAAGIPTVDGKINLKDTQAADTVRKRIMATDARLWEKSRATSALNKDGSLIEFSGAKPVTKIPEKESQRKKELSTLAKRMNQVKPNKRPQAVLQARRAQNQLEFGREGIVE